MQIEKHIKIVPTPTGAVVFFAGQVCLNVNEHSGRYTWAISPVFAKLTTGISTFGEMPITSWDGQETMAEAIADGLTKLDEMKAFYGVIDMPEDTYVGEHLDEEVDEDTEDLLAESFVVRQVGQSRNHPPRIMISAAAVIGRAREMAKEAGEKSHIKFIKLAHNEIASNVKAESEEIKGDQIDEFVQYEDALPDVFQLIKEDCRAEALAMSDSLVEAHQLANELFEDIVEEYLNELNKSTLGSYVKNAAYHASNLSSNAGSFKTKAMGHISDRDGKMKPAHDISDANWEKHHTDDEESDRQTKIKMKRHAGINKAIEKMTKEEVEEIDEATHQELLDGAQKAYVEATRKGNGAMVKHYGAEILKHKANIVRAKKLKNEEVESIDEAKPLQGDAYWKSKEEESKQEFLRSQRKALGLPEPIKRGRGKPTLIDRDSLKTRAHSNVEAGKRPTAGFDRNEKIHFVRHLKNHPDFADKHVSQAGRPTGTTKVAKEQKVLAKKKQDTAFSMWAGLGKK